MGRKIEAIVVSVDCGEQLAATLPDRARQVDRMVVVTATHDGYTAEVARDAGAELVVTDACYEGGDAFNKGRMLNAGMEALKHRDWVIFSDADIFWHRRMVKRLWKITLDAGSLYYTRRIHLPAGVTEPDWRSIGDYGTCDPGQNFQPWGYFQLCHARWLRPFPTCFCSAGTIDNWFRLQWPPESTVPVPNEDEFAVLHIDHGETAGRWNGSRPTAGRWCYAGQTLHAQEHILRESWPVPCDVRRTEVMTLKTETARFSGPPPLWQRPTLPGVRYEFAVRS